MTHNEVGQTGQNGFSSSDGLPEEWSSVRLGDGLVVDVQPGFACGENNRDGRGIAHLRPMNVHKEGKIDLSTLKYVPVTKADQDKRLLRRGDVIFNNTNSPELVGKTAYYDLPESKAFSNHMTRLRCQTEILDPQFCAIVLHQKWRGGYFRLVCSHHVSQSSVGRAVLLNTRIVLPPLAEQKRIVAKVEQLLARVNAARDRLAKVPKILKRFRQSVLAAACSGRLTADWKDKNPNLESAERLVDRIFAKREEQFEMESKTSKIGGRKIPKKPAGLRPRKVEVKDLPKIPERWAWVYLPDLGYMSRGKSRHRPRNAPHLYGGPYPFIQTGDIAQCGGRITSHQQTYSEEGLAQSRLWPDDTVCITIAANIASSAMLTYPACFPDSVVGVNPDVNLCLPEYLEFFVRTAQADLDQFAPATAQKNINVSILNDVVVPLPPFAEQEEIVRRVESLFKLAATIEKRVAVATAQAEKLTQSILARVFKGELVSTEAELARWEGRDYEPASVLLERIKAEREALEKEKPIKKQAVSSRRRHRKSAKEAATESKRAVSADTSEGAKRISTKPDLSSHGTAIPPVSNRGTPAIQQKAASITAKKHRRETFQHAVPLSDLQTDEVMAAFRKACRGRGAMSREELLKEVSVALGCQHLSSGFKEPLKGHLRAAIRRKIIGTNGHEIWLETKSMDDYERADLVSFLGSVMRLDTEYDREEVIRALSNYLGFRRLTDGVRSPIKSAINSAIRQGDIVGSISTIRRIL